MWLGHVSYLIHQSIQWRGPVCFLIVVTCIVTPSRVGQASYCCDDHVWPVLTNCNDRVVNVRVCGSSQTSQYEDLCACQSEYSGTVWQTIRLRLEVTECNGICIYVMYPTVHVPCRVAQATTAVGSFNREYLRDSEPNC
jgi:hypothetical protein